MLAEHFIAKSAQLNEQLSPYARSLGVELLLIEVPCSPIPVRFVERYCAQCRQSGQVGGVEIECHLETLLRLCPVAQLFFECLADPVIHFDALRAIVR